MALRDFAIGDKVKFSGGGLYLYKGHFEPTDLMLSWRFEIVGRTKYSLLLKRLDIPADVEAWSCYYFEKDN